MRATRNQKPLLQAMGQIVKKMTEIIKADRLRECVRVRLRVTVRVAWTLICD